MLNGVYLGQKGWQFLMRGAGGWGILSFEVPIVFLARAHIIGDEPTEIYAEHPSDEGSLESAAELSLGGYARLDSARSSSHPQLMENYLPPMPRAAVSGSEGLGSLFRCDGEEPCPREEEREDVASQVFDEPWMAVYLDTSRRVGTPRE